VGASTPTVRWDRYLRGRFGGVHTAAQQIEHVADFQAHVGGRREPRRRQPGSWRGAARGCDIDTVVKLPDLGSPNLQDQHVVFVVM